MAALVECERGREPLLDSGDHQCKLQLISPALAGMSKTSSVPDAGAARRIRLAKSWREHGDRVAADKLTTSHLRLVVKSAMAYVATACRSLRAISEGNVGLLQAVKRFEPDMGFRLSTYAIWWIKAAIQEYILRSWSLVKMGTTANQKKLFFNLRKAKSKISALEDGDLLPDQVQIIATRLGVTEQNVIEMNRRLGGDVCSTRRSVRAKTQTNGRTG